MSISREELYALVWAEPMTKVSARFEVSGSYMARICTILNVPRPPRGHWAKLAHGKKSPREPLPEARPGDQLTWSQDGPIERQPRPKQAPRSVRSRSKRGAKPAPDHVHHLIRGAKRLIEHSRRIDEGAYLKPYKKLVVDVTSSKACLDKALGFANELFNALVSAGHRVVIAPADEEFRRAIIDEREVPDTKRDPYRYYGGLWSPQRPTVVYVDQVAIGLAVVEMSEKVLFRYVGGKYVREADYVPPRSNRYHSDYTFTTTREIPSGRLRLAAFSPYRPVDWEERWDETKKDGLRSRIKSIVRTVETEAVALVGKLEEAERQAEIRRQEWLVQQERRRREEDRQRVAKSIEESRAKLRQVIEQWARVMSVERFFAGVEERAAGLSGGDQEALLERLGMAREFLGTQDPLDFFRSWKTPEELYRPAYSDDNLHDDA